MKSYRNYKCLWNRISKLNRITSYLFSIWRLYLYGQRSKPKQADEPSLQPSKYQSAFFMSKAGRFFTVGASGLLVNYVASLLFLNLVPHVWYMYATLFGIIISVTSNFILNKTWTFDDRNFSSKHFLRQYAFFLGFCAIGATLQLSLVYVFVELLGIQYTLALIMAVLIASVSNFLLNKKITFGEKIWE